MAGFALNCCGKGNSNFRCLECRYPTAPLGGKVPPPPPTFYPSADGASGGLFVVL